MSRSRLCTDLDGAQALLPLVSGKGRGNGIKEPEALPLNPFSIKFLTYVHQASGRQVSAEKAWTRTSPRTWSQTSAKERIYGLQRQRASMHVFAKPLRRKTNNKRCLWFTPSLQLNFLIRLGFVIGFEETNCLLNNS